MSIPGTFGDLHGKVLHGYRFDARALEQKFPCSASEFIPMWSPVK